MEAASLRVSNAKGTSLFGRIATHMVIVVAVLLFFA